MALTVCIHCNGNTSDNPKTKCRNCGQYQDPSALIDDLKLDVDFLKNEILSLKAQLTKTFLLQKVSLHEVCNLWQTKENG